MIAMTKVLVVCKTRMKSGLCVGGLVERSYARIRLLTAEGYNQPTETKFNVGDIWECRLAPRRGRKPHTEDMLITPRWLARTVPNMRDFLLQRLDLEAMPHSALFDGSLQVAKSGSAYISERGGVPAYAHAFWMPLHSLKLKHERNSHYYYLQDPYSRNRFRLPYVGLDEPPPTLPPGCLLHLSLARWWLRPGTREERCYLQLSGIFI